MSTLPAAQDSLALDASCMRMSASPELYCARSLDAEKATLSHSTVTGTNDDEHFYFRNGCLLNLIGSASHMVQPHRAPVEGLRVDEVQH